MTTLNFAEADRSSSLATCLHVDAMVCVHDRQYERT